MEAKYKKFLEFDWQNSQEWQLYYSNLYPTPPGNKIEKYKKKFYKNKIDPEFDINYSPNTNTNNNSNNYTGYNTANQNYQYSTNPVNKSESIFNIETILFVCFFLSLPLKLYSRLILTIALFTRAIRYCGAIQFNVTYLQSLIQTDCFLPLLSHITTCMDRFNYFVIFPVGVSALIFLCENVHSRKIEDKFPFFKKYVDWVIKNKIQINIHRAESEIFVGVLLIFGLFFKLNSIFSVIAYWQISRVKYIMSSDLQKAYYNANCALNNIKNNNACPGLIKKAIDTVQWAFEKFGKINTDPNQQRSGGCNIY